MLLLAGFPPLIKFVPPPPAIVAPATPGEAKFTAAPPIKLGEPLVFCWPDNPGNPLTPVAITAYGAGVKFWAGFKAANPLTPSLNQIRNCRYGCVNRNVLIEAMLPTVVSPNATVNNPLFTLALIAAAGSLPFVLVPSLLQ